MEGSGRNMNVGIDMNICNAMEAVQNRAETRSGNGGRKR